MSDNNEFGNKFIVIDGEDLIGNPFVITVYYNNNDDVIKLFKREKWLIIKEKTLKNIVEMLEKKRGEGK